MEWPNKAELTSGTGFSHEMELTNVNWGIISRASVSHAHKHAVK